MIKTLADRLAEALAEFMHQRVRKEWGFPDDEKITNDDLIKEKYRGIVTSKFLNRKEISGLFKHS